MFGDNFECINRKLFNNSLSKCRSRGKYFSGARTKDLEYYVTRELNQEKPDIVVIHIGSNDTDFRQLRRKTVKTIEKYIVNTGKKCGESGVSKVLSSSVLVKNNINKAYKNNLAFK